MSESIDKRIVEMQFDNAQFERGISKTLASLEKLNSALSIKSNFKGLDNIDKALSKVDFGKMEGALDHVSDRFSAFGIVGMTAIQRVTNSVIDLASNLAKGLTVQPLTDGLDEYTLKMNSIKTIQTNTLGKSSLTEINEALSELNNYADKTIYNFAEMTRNIGTFTSAGVDLDNSVTAIKGIANLAASSGASSAKASNAMYQLSQALASGTVKLMDWNSVVNSDMGGKLFQNALIRTSEALNTGAKEAIKKEGSFRDSLKEEWLTSEVLIKTLRNFTLTRQGATKEQIEANKQMLLSEGYTEKQIKQIFKEADAAEAAATKVKTFQQMVDTAKEELGSGWATSWEYIFGDLEEAEVFWTSVSDKINGVLGSIAQARNDFLKDWHDAGGRDALVDLFENLVGIAEDVLKPIKEAFEEVFEPLKGVDFAQATKEFSEFIKNLRNNLNNSEAGQKFLGTVKDIFKAIFQVVHDAIPIVQDAVGFALGIIGGLFIKVGDVLAAIDLPDKISKMQSFLSDVIGKIQGFLKPLGDKIQNAVGFIKTAIMDNVPKIFEILGDLWNDASPNLEKLRDFLGDRFRDAVTAFKDAWENAGPAFENFQSVVGDRMAAAGEVLSKAWELIQPIFENIKNFFTGAWEVVTKAFEHADFNADPFMRLLDNIGQSVSNFVDSVGEKGLNFETIGEFLGSLRGDFGVLWDELAPKFEIFTQDIGSAIYDNLEGPMKDLADWILGISDPLGNLMENAGTNIKPIFEFFSGIKLPSFDDLNPFNKVNDTLVAASGGATEAYDSVLSLKSIAKAISNPVKTISDLLGGAILGAFTSLNNFLDNPEIEKLGEKLITLGVNAGMLAGMYEAIRCMEAVSKAMGSIADIAKNMALIAGNINSLTTAITNQIKTQVILNIALSVLAVAGAILMVSLVDPDRLASSAGVIISCMVILLTFMSILSIESSKFTMNPAKLAGMGGIFAALAGIFLAIGGVIFVLGHVMKEDEAKRAVDMMGSIMLMLGLFTGAMTIISWIGSDLDAKVAKDLLGIVGTLLLMAVVFKVLASMQPEEWSAALDRMITSMVLLGVFLGVIRLILSEKFGVKGLSDSLRELSIGIAVLAVAMIALSQVPIEKLVQGFVGLAMIFTVITAFAFIMNKLKLSYTMMQTGVGMIALAVAVGILAAAMSLIVFVAGDNAATVIMAGLAMVGMMLALGKMADMIAYQGPKILAAVPGILALIVGIAAMSGLMVLMTMFQWETIQDGLLKLAVVIAVLVVALAALGAIGKYLGAGLWMVGLFLLEIAAAVVVLGLGIMVLVAALNVATNVLPRFAEAWNQAWGTLLGDTEKLKTSVADGAASIFGGFAVGVAKAAPDIGDSVVSTLKAIAERLPEAGEAFAYGGVGLVLGLIRGLSSAIQEYGPSIAEGVLGLLGQAAEGLSHFIDDRFKDVKNAIAGIPDLFKSEEEKVADHTRKLEELANLTKYRVINAATVNPKDKEGQAQYISEFLNEQLEKYGVTSEELYNLIKSNTDKFGEETVTALETYNQALAKGAEEQQNPLTDPNNEKDKADAAAKGANIGDTMVKGLTSILGDNFNPMSVVGSGEKWDMSAIEDVVKGSGLEIGDVFSAGMGEGFNMDEIKKQFGEDFDPNSMMDLEKMQDSIGGSFGDLGSLGADSFAFGDNGEGGLVPGLEFNMEKADLAQFITNEGVNTENLSKNMSTAGEEAAKSFATSFKDSLDVDGTEKIEKGLKTLSQEEKFEKTAKADGTSAVKGFEKGLENFASKAADAVKEAKKQMGEQDHYNKAYSIGTEMVNGVKAGLDNNSGPLAAAAAQVITNAISAMQVAGQIQSPSKKTMWIADMMALGLINGLKRMAPLAERETKDAMSRTVAVMMAEASYLSGLMSDMEDNQPVIRPVLDLSDFAVGAAQMDRLMPSSVNSTLGFAARMMTDRGVAGGNQNSTNNTITVNLNYKAGADANQMVRDIAFALQSKSLLEA